MDGLGLDLKELTYVGIVIGSLYTCQLAVSLAATQSKSVSCNQSEMNILVFDWLQLNGLAVELRLS